MATACRCWTSANTLFESCAAILIGAFKYGRRRDAIAHHADTNETHLLLAHSIEQGIAGVLPEGRRNFAFGVFYLGYGAGWLAGSVTTGFLYEHARLALVVFQPRCKCCPSLFFH